MVATGTTLAVIGVLAVVAAVVALVRGLVRRPLPQLVAVVGIALLVIRLPVRASGPPRPDPCVTGDPNYCANLPGGR